jgi:serine/threonine-protein kinase
MSTTIFKPGDVFERYVILALIGQGYMGEVYRARDRETGTEIALKCLRLQHLDNPDIVRRARMEAVALADLAHPNIVRVLETGLTDDGMVWMAMELLRGKTLRDLLRSAGACVPVSIALRFMIGILDGVAAAHQRSIIHRDLKPENIFVTMDYEMRVLDLGTAKFLGYGLKTTDHLVIIGTVPYMSPEHLSGTPVDARTDVFAMGIILYEMLAGRHPFKEAMTNTLDMGAAQMFQTPPRLSALAPWVPDFVAVIAERAMAKRREARFSSSVEMGLAVRGALRRFEQEGWAARERVSQAWRHALVAGGQRPADAGGADEGAADEQAPTTVRSHNARGPAGEMARPKTVPLSLYADPAKRTVLIARRGSGAGAPPGTQPRALVTAPLAPNRASRSEVFVEDEPRALVTAPLAPNWRSSRPPELPFNQGLAVVEPAGTMPVAPIKREPLSSDGIGEEGGTVDPMRSGAVDSPPSPARVWSTPWRLRRARLRQRWAAFVIAGVTDDRMVCRSRARATKCGTMTSRPPLAARRSLNSASHRRGTIPLAGNPTDVRSHL